MKKVLTFLFFATLCFCNCGCTTNSHKVDEQSVLFESTDNKNGILEVQKLIRQVINWGESTRSIIVDPVLVKEGVYSFDKNMLKENQEKLIATGFFSDEFIENYKQIILTLDRKLISKEFDEWVVGDLPPFKFANDVSPWCMCQGFSADQFGGVEVIKLNSKSGELIWKWKEGNSWLDFKFKVVNDNKRWKISYIQGFDYKEGIKGAEEI